MIRRLELFGNFNMMHQCELKLEKKKHLLLSGEFVGFFFLAKYGITLIYDSFNRLVVPATV